MRTRQQQLQPAVDRIRRRGIRAALFDMDGVLVDSIDAHMHAWNETLRQDRLQPMDVSAYLSYVGKSNRVILTTHCAGLQLELPEARKTQLIERKERLLRESMRTNARSTPGVTLWLERLRARGVRCAVASSGEMANIVTVMEQLRLANFFSALVSGSNLPATKPDPQVFLLAAAALGTAPERCLVIEDAPAGIQAAAIAGMVSCAISTTVPADELRQADLLLEDLSELDPEVLFVE
jgi:beta-phosphoglucomutase